MSGYATFMSIPTIKVLLYLQTLYSFAGTATSHHAQHILIQEL